MPTLTVDAEALYERLKGHVVTLPETFALTSFVKVLEKLAFDYGLEYDGLDETCATLCGAGAAAMSGIMRPRVRIDIPANRYDLLCLEGLAEALIRYADPSALPFGRYKYVSADGSEMTGAPSVTMRVKASTFPLRPYCVGAIFRGVKFDGVTFASFIDLQDKLHQNLARRRVLVSMGTHDLDKLTGTDFVYDCLPRKNGFRFVPLNQSQEVDGDGMMELLAESYLKPYLGIIADSSVFPVVLDSAGHVASVPPIINSELSKMTLDTTNVLVEITATDHHKAEIVLDQIVAFMSDKIPMPYTVEPVRVLYESSHPGVDTMSLDEANGNSHEIITPRLKTCSFKLDIDYCRKIIGSPSLDSKVVLEVLPKMGLRPHVNDQNPSVMTVECPITRRDILHPCDIVEDIAIAIGYNNISYKATRAVKFQTMQNLSETIRRLVSEAGWKECLTFGLISQADFKAALRSIDNTSAFYAKSSVPVVVKEPKTREFEIVRPTLIPGLLNTLSSNQAQNLPIRLFEIGEVVSATLSTDGGPTAGGYSSTTDDNYTMQKRNFSALMTDANRSCLEHVHGLLDYVLSRLGFCAEYSTVTNTRAHHKYYLRPVDTKGPFLEKRQVDIMAYNKDDKSDQVCIGVMGIIHPDTLGYYGIPFPCSLFELTLEPIIRWLDKITLSAP